MTNADKYLKNNVRIEEILNSFGEMYADNELQKGVLMLGLKNFLETECKTSTPTLTEDERVILRNIDKDYYNFIGRQAEMLYVSHTSHSFNTDSFDNYFGGSCLFQFIKERRRIFYWRTFERRIKDE